MGVFKEIERADGTGTTTFYRISEEHSTVETDGDEITREMFDYNDALNKPSINGVALVGNKTSEDLGLQPAGDYLTEIPEEYITESELEAQDLASKQYVIDQVNNAEHFHREIVDGLPLIGKDNVLYLVKKEGTTGDVYNEYIWTGTDYEFMGTTAPDLTDIYTKEEANELLDKKVNKVNGKDLSSNDFTNEEKAKLATLENYDDSELQTKVAALHNYDDSAVKGDIAALQENNEALSLAIDNIEEEIEDKITLVRLIKSGDAWIWNDVLSNNLTFATAQEMLGHEDTILILEYAEMDGKITPTEYISLDDSIMIYYTDENNIVHVLTGADSFVDVELGENLHYQHSVSSKDDLPETAIVGETRITDDTEDFYIYTSKGWKPTDKGTVIDLSNYLAKDNTLGYTPTGKFNPATKQYVDENISAIFIPTKVGQLTNDAEYITKRVNDLTNYYTKSQTYTKNEVDSKIASASGSVTIEVNGVSTSKPKFYAPLESGTSGQILTSNGASNAPTWEDLELPTGDYVLKTGDTMSGILNVGDINGAFGSLRSTGVYVKSGSNFGGHYLSMTADGVSSGPLGVYGSANDGFSLDSAEGLKFTKDGGTAHPTKITVNHEGIKKNYDEVDYPVLYSHKLTSTEYEELENKSDDTLYFITDKSSVYRGEDLYGAKYTGGNNIYIGNDNSINYYSGILDGTAVFGWASTCYEGENMTEDFGLTTTQLNSFIPGRVAEWSSRVQAGASKSAVINAADYFYGYKDEGGRYYGKTLYIYGNTNYSYVYDTEGETVYFGYSWPDNYSGGVACFLGDTLLLMADGSTKKFKDVEAGDKVLSPNLHLDTLETRPIIKILSHEETEIYEITVNREKIKCTGSHPFWTVNKGYVLACDIEKDDELTTKDGKVYKVTKVEKKEVNETVYEAVVEQNHTYYIGKNNILAYNEASAIREAE